MKNRIVIFTVGLVLILGLCGCALFNTEPLLSDLQVDGTTVEGFDSQQFRYSINVGNETDKVVIEPQVEYSKFTTTVDGPESLAVGDNIYTITVLYKNKSCDYTVTVNRAMSDNCDLANLSIEKVNLSPAFSPDITEYTADVDYFTNSVNLTYKAQKDESTVTLTSPEIIEKGENTVKISVISQSGNCTKDYTIKINRPTQRPGVKELQDMGYTKFVALTFDDGPCNDTLRLLDILDKHEAKASFFVVGTFIEGREDIILAEHQRGHQVCNHSWNHSYMKSGWSDGACSENFAKCSTAIESITGQRPTCLRPPGGFWGRGDTFDGMNVIFWDVDPMDWYYKDTDTVVNNVLNDTKNGDIILLHDIHKTSVDAADIIIEKLMAEGYIFLTVDELKTVDWSRI